MAGARAMLARGGDDWFAMDETGRQLREVLPSEYALVVEPRIYGEELDAVVVGPQGIFVLTMLDWPGRIRAARVGHWEVTDEDGHATSLPSPAPRAQRGVRAVRTFMRDEFPRLAVTVQGLLLLTSSDAHLEHYGTTDPPTVPLNSLLQEITAVRGPRGAVTLEREQIDVLAQAFRERELASRQKAEQPFVFRSGGLLGSGRKVWTIRDAVRHMDRRPDDGVYHLRNGTLERWLREQGARHLAELAREVTSDRETDTRMVVERFLIGTGLVRRPSIKWRPQRVDFGYALPGEQSAARCRVRKGLRRGYLFGRVHASEPWVRVEPQRFSGNADLHLWASSETLSIQHRPHEAAVHLDTSAAEEPVSVPLRLRVVAMPHGVQRYVLRPLVGLVLGLVFGTAIGYLIGRHSLGMPAFMQRLGFHGDQVPDVLYGLLVGIAWGILGGWRGVRQRSAWPIGYATIRWLLRLGIWTLALGVIALAALAALVWVAAIPVVLISSTGLLLLLGALALANVPATLSEVRASMDEASTALEAVERRSMRPLVAALVGVAIIAVLGVGAFALEPVYSRWQMGEAQENVLTWIGLQADHLGEWVELQLDRMYLERYDRRAPTRVPTPAPEAAAAPSAED